jgi:hypothetical protein
MSISRAHAAGGILALTLITTFFVSSVVVELFGDEHAVVLVKTLILLGVFVLAPGLMVTARTGRVLAGRRRGPLVRGKKRRTVAAAVIGITVLIPCAVLLHRLSAAGHFGAAFYGIQAVELAGGAVNITLLALNVRGGLRLAGRTGRRVPVAVRP